MGKIRTLFVLLLYFTSNLYSQKNNSISFGCGDINYSDYYARYEIEKWASYKHIFFNNFPLIVGYNSNVTTRPVPLNYPIGYNSYREIDEVYLNVGYKYIPKRDSLISISAGTGPVYRLIRNSYIDYYYPTGAGGGGEVLGHIERMEQISYMYYVAINHVIYKFISGGIYMNQKFYSGDMDSFSIGLGLSVIF